MPLKILPPSVARRFVTQEAGNHDCFKSTMTRSASYNTGHSDQQELSAPVISVWVAALQSHWSIPLDHTHQYVLGIICTRNGSQPSYRKVAPLVLRRSVISSGGKCAFLHPRRHQLAWYGRLVGSTHVGTCCTWQHASNHKCFVYYSWNIHWPRNFLKPPRCVWPSCVF